MTAISKIEELEQEVMALKNEALENIDYEVLKSNYEQAIKEVVELRGLVKIVETERNTLSQVVRILASDGRIDPVRETEELQMLKEMHE